MYAPPWFEIKLKPQCYYDTIHLWKANHLSCFLSFIERDVVGRIIQQNGYYRHPENILLNIMIDKWKHMQNLQAEKVARETDDRHPSSSDDIRKFTISTVSSILIQPGSVEKWKWESQV